MRAHGLVTFMAMAVSLTQTATPPSIFALLQSEVIAGQNDKESFDKQYIYIAGGPGPSRMVPLFLRGNEIAQFLTLEEAQRANTTGPALYYLAFDVPGSPSIVVNMGFNTAPYANWETVTFANAKNSTHPELQNRFYVNGTGSDIHLLWSNDKKAQGGLEYLGWLR